MYVRLISALLLFHSAVNLVSFASTEEGRPATDVDAATSLVFDVAGITGIILLELGTVLRITFDGPRTQLGRQCERAPVSLSLVVLP